MNKSRVPENFAELINLWPKPSITNFAADLGVEYVNAQQMKFRNSIHSRHWPAIVKAAKRRDIAHVNLALLAELAARREQEVA